MTIASESIKAGPFSGNDSTTTFAFTFKCFSSDGTDLKVILTNSSGVDTTLTITTDYTVSLNSNQDTNPGGSITTTGSSSPPATGEKLTILNEPAYTQGTDLITGGGFYPDVVETALDRSTVLARRAKEQVGRSLQIPVSDSAGTSVELVSNTLRANKALVFDADGDVGISVDNYTDQTTASAASAATASAAATAAQSAASAVAIPFLMDTSTTMGDPAGTNFRLNNSTVSSVSLIAFGDTSEDGVDVTDYLMTWDDSTSTINGHLILVQEGTPANWAVFSVGVLTDNTDWVQCAVTHVDSGGSLFTNDITVRCQFIRCGDKGDTGSTGSTGATGSGEGLEMAFESTTTDTDQGAGTIFLNHSSPGSATIVYLDDLDSNGASINSFVDSFDDSGSSVKGRIVIKKQIAPENYMIFSFGGAVTSASTYSKLTSCTHVVSAGTISDTDAVFVTFSRTGDKGDTGSTGSTGAQGASVGTALLWDSDTSDADSGNGKIFGNHGTVSAISQLYIDDLDSAGTNIEAWIATMDDSTTTAARGTITIVKTTTQAQMAVFTVNSAVVDGTGYWKIPCDHVMSNVGSLADGDAVTVTFTRTGNIGVTGSTGSTGSTGATGTASSGFHYQFETDTDDSDKGQGRVWLNHSTKSSASILYIDDDDNDGTDISAFTATWDDSSATSDKGFIKIQSRATPTDYAVFKISSSGTDGTAYWKFPVTHLVSAGTFSDTEVVDVFFTRSGDSGGVANRTVDTMTGDGSDVTLALSQSPGSTNNCTCFIDGVGQHPGTDFNIVGSTLTFTTAPALSTVVVAICGGNESIGTPSDNTVTSAKIVNGAILDADVNASAAIATSKLSGAVTSIPSHGLGALASLATVGNSQIDNNAVDEDKLKDALIADFADVTVTASDAFLYGDATDSGNTKKDTVQGILDLVSAGGPYYGSGDEWIRYNDDEINANITIAAGKNASSVGPITIGSSYAITVNGVYTVI